MKFADAFREMRSGNKVKLPTWGGYWYWDTEKETIIMHLRTGDEVDIRESTIMSYTMENICSEEWLIADEENCPELGGTEEFGFGAALKYLARGYRLARKGWNGKGLSVVYQKMVLKFGQTKTIQSAEKGPKLVYFIGPTGVGKTTTIAKIASRFSVVEKLSLIHI